MKLRTRLFLWVGILFFLVFGFSIILEIHSTDSHLEKAEANLREQILGIQEKNRDAVEKYLKVSLVEEQAQIDALFIRITRDPKLAATLFLDPAQPLLAAPAHAAYLFKNDKWIDLIQSTKDNQLTSLLIPIDFPMKTSYQVPIEKDLSWVLIEGDKEFATPFIGVRLPIKQTADIDLAYVIDELVETDWGLMVLFSPEAIVNFEKREIPEREVGEGIEMIPLLAAIEKGAEYVKKFGTNTALIKRDIEEKSKGNPFKGIPLDQGISCMGKHAEAVDFRIVQLSQRGDQAILLSALASLFHSGEFGSTPFAKEAPKGIAQFPLGNTAGHLALTNEVFFKQKAYDDAAFYKAHPSRDDCQNIASSMAVITFGDIGRVFLGNCLRISNGKNVGYLTIAVDTDELLQDLALSSHKVSFLVHGGKVVNFAMTTGEEVHLKTPFPFQQAMLDNKSGMVDWEGQSYFYQQITPFKQLDLHFFTLQPQKEAFALIDSLDKGSREVISEVSFDMRLIAVIALILVLFLLHNVAKRITNPIVKLANVTKQVASGQLEGIDLPPPPKGKNDEIATLCTSFEQMVTGLREKEKVKGVLNKVVSPEIAQEILKGQVHLGGEERKVTVLFADIRDFTGMTASKEPKEVIEMLNACMTKVSQVIDSFGGVIDKYVGDEVMALFGAPLEKEDSTLKAIQSGLEMIRILKEWNTEREKQGFKPVDMGVGIHTGVVLAGNMGAENRLNYTVIGSNVNIAARLCSAAQRMEILISEATLNEPHVKENIEVEPLPPTSLKGFEETFTLYRVKGARHV